MTGNGINRPDVFNTINDELRTTRVGHLAANQEGLILNNSISSMLTAPLKLAHSPARFLWTKAFNPVEMYFDTNVLSVSIFVHCLGLLT